MTSSTCTILAPIFTCDRFYKIARKNAPIGGKSVLVHASENHALWIIKAAIWENRQCPWNIWHAKYRPIYDSNSCCEKWVPTEKYIGDDLQPMREQDTGQREVRGGVIDHRISVILRYFFISSRVRFIVKRSLRTRKSHAVCNLLSPIHCANLNTAATECYPR